MTRPTGPRPPYKLDDGADPKGVRATILRYLSAGSYLETAASAAGINRDQLRVWLKNAAADRKRGEATVYTDFADDVEQAMSKHEGGLVALIVKAGQTQWVAAAWLLERRFPGRYEQHRTTEREKRLTARAERARAEAEAKREAERAAAAGAAGDTARTPEELDALQERLFGDRGAGRE